jgi:hypothetical protein
MIWKIAVAGDLHKRVKDISTIKGYVNCCDYTLESLIKMIKEEQLNAFISLGDWYDKGYVDDVAAAIADVSREHYIHELLNGNFYGVIGNHIRLRLDSNPELMLMQPHPTLKSRKEVRREHQIIKTPNQIRVGNIQISLVHNLQQANKLEDYIIRRLPDVKYHIACVHDPRFVPLSKLALTNTYAHNTLDSEIVRTLSEVDLCICGDIHMPLGLFDISPKTKMIVPGSLTNTNASLKTRHSSIKIPILTIDDKTDEFSLNFKDFDLNLNMLTFDEKAEEKIIDKIKTLRGNSLDKLYNEENTGSIMSTGISSFNFREFLDEQDYTPNDRKLIKSVMKIPEDIMSLIKIHYEDLQIIEE